MSEVPLQNLPEKQARHGLCGGRVQNGCIELCGPCQNRPPSPPPWREPGLARPNMGSTNPQLKRTHNLSARTELLTVSLPAVDDKRHAMGTSLIRRHTLPGPYSRPVPRALQGAAAARYPRNRYRTVTAVTKWLLTPRHLRTTKEVPGIPGTDKTRKARAAAPPHVQSGACSRVELTFDSASTQPARRGAAPTVPRAPLSTTKSHSRIVWMGQPILLYKKAAFNLPKRGLNPKHPLPARSKTRLEAHNLGEPIKPHLSNPQSALRLAPAPSPPSPAAPQPSWFRVQGFGFRISNFRFQV